MSVNYFISNNYYNQNSVSIETKKIKYQGSTYQRISQMTHYFVYVLLSTLCPSTPGPAINIDHIISTANPVHELSSLVFHRRHYYCLLLLFQLNTCSYGCFANSFYVLKSFLATRHSSTIIL